MHRHASVNRIYRLVWNHAANSWVPAAETTRGRGKGSCKALIATALSLVAGLTEAGPLGGQVVGGSGHIGQDGALTTITQTSPVLSLAWTSFNIAAQETVDFVQPSASAIAVNRITGGNGTQILGHLNANGQLYLINPNGIVFGRGAQVDVGGLVASTLDINDASLGADARSFSGSGSGAVLNQGTINATGDGSGGGYVALLGNHVGNQGTISARLGTVALGAGSAATLTFNGNSLLHLQVDRSVLKTVAENGGLIRADGGQVLMSAGAKDALLASVVNNTGVIEARTVENHGGTITLLGGMAAGTVNVAGTLDASAPAGGNGGFIETSAAHVEVADAARITTAAPAGLYGSWLIDPQDYVVAASGGDITGAALSANLATTNEKLQSSAGAAAGSGNINVNDSLSWSANTTLTLEASNNVNVNASLTATGNTAGIVIRANTVNGNEAASGPGIFTLNNGAAINLPGTNPTLSIAGTSYIVINSVGAAADATTAPSTPSLQGIGALANVTGHYALGSNIDASATSTWNAGAGFNPIGFSYAPFSGTLDGLGHTINNLFINRPTTSVVGLVGYASGAHIQNVGLVGGSVTGLNTVGSLLGSGNGSFLNVYATTNVAGTTYIGGLVGYFNGGTISYSHAAGSVSGADTVGGLVGYLNGGTISNSYAAGTVNGGDTVGGFVGSARYTSINNVYANGNVSGHDYIGGLVGSARFASINHVYATGNLTGTDVIGGLIGSQSYGSLSSGHATGTVNGNANVGGLVGYNGASSISTSYANGAVTGVDSVGGLVGGTGANSSIDNSYATGAVSGTTNVGGLVGYHYGGGSYGGGPSHIRTSYATGAVSGTTNVGGLVGSNVNGGGYGTSIDTTYATGRVTGSFSVGGLVGHNDPYLGTITNAYWNTTTTGQSKSAQTDGFYSSSGGLTTQQMQTASNFAGFNFSTTPGASGNSWVMVDVDGGLNNAGGYVAGVSTPSVPGATFPMLTSEYSTVINNAHQLQLMALAPGASYTLAANIDAGATKFGGGRGGDVWSTPGGFFPIGTGQMGGFSGSFDGLGHTISNLTMNWPAGDLHYVGLFGLAQPGSIIQNVGLIDASVTSTGDVFSQPANGTGALVGTNEGSISNSYATGAVTGSSYAGGLVGNNYGVVGSASISNSHAAVTVSGVSQVGGLAGGNYGVGGLISNSYATGTITGSSMVGGLVGLNNAAIVNSYAIGAVNGTTNAGGLVGANNASIANSYATGAVHGNSYVGGLTGSSDGSLANVYATGTVVGTGFDMTSLGGLVGRNYGSIANAYATGSVAGDYHVGGLVGDNRGFVENTYATGSVTGSLAAGGLVGYNSGIVSQSFWNSDVIADGVGIDDGTTLGGGGLTGTGMFTTSNFANAGWSISSTGGSNAVWRIYEGYTAPLLSSFLTLLTVTASNASHVFDGSAFSGNGVTYSATPNANLLGTLTYGPAQDAARAGSYAITPSGLYSNQQGYSITAVSATLTISPLALTGALAAGTSVYGSPLTPGAVTFSNLVTGFTAVTSPVTVSTTGSLSGGGQLKVGNYTGVESAGSALTGSDAGNYTFAGASGGNYSVTPLALSGPIATGNSVYGAALAPGAMNFSNAVVGDAVAATGTVAVSTSGNLSTSGHFSAGTHVGSETIGSGLTGADAANYTFAGASGDYTVSALALSGVIAAGNSVYGATLARGAVTLSTPITGDAVAAGTVTVNTTGHTSSSGNLTAGTHVGLETVGSTLTGADAANYTFAGASGNYVVSALALSGSIADGSSVYGATLAPGATSFSNAIVGDTVAAGTATVNTTGHTSTSGNFTAGTHVGSETVGSTLTGADAGNYTFAGASGNYTVTQLALNGTLASGNSVYGAVLAPGATSFSNAIAGDTVTAGTVTVDTAGHTSSSGNFTAGTHAGSETVGTALTGADAGNYSFAGASGNYTVSTLALTGAIADGNSVYGATLAPGATSFSNAIFGDAVTAGTVTVNTVGHTSSSGNLTAGTHVGIQTVDSTLSGADAGNYNFAGASGNYTVATLALNGVIADGNSVYGAALAPGMTSFSNAIVGDAVAATGTVLVSTTGNLSTSGHFTAGTHVGSETVGNALTGSDAANYTFAGASADYVVTPLALIVEASGANKTYDGTTTASVTLTGSVLPGDQASFIDSGANFASRNAGTAQTVTVTGVGIQGADAANYELNNASALTAATISPATLTVAGLAAGNKVYDGTTVATLTGGSLVGVVAGDAALLTLTDAGSFMSKNVGTAIGVTANETLGGSGAGNYVLVQPNGLAADITPAALTYTATHTTLAAGQVPTGLMGSVNGFVANETQADATSGTLAWTTPADAQSHPGAYAIDGGGLTATNYLFVEAPGNATALALEGGSLPPPPPSLPPHSMPPAPPHLPPKPPLVAATVPQTLLSTIAQLQATVPAGFEESARDDRVEPATLLASRASSPATSPDCSNGVDPMTCADGVTQRVVGDKGTLLHVVDGGVRLSK